MNLKEIPIKLLLVEDNPDDVVLIKFAFNEQKVNCDIFWTKDGVEAENFLKKLDKYVDVPTPDIVILDLNLPKKNGFSVLKFIKSSPVLKELPVIVLTTSTNPDDIRKCYAGHANCYIKKPSDLQGFLEIIGNVKTYWLDTVILPS
ncbi:MAG: chemotaxis family two-component system response regulator Rcp1 [Parvicella sp.]|jgi:chemotaxis family two-component system response regulator Rcp1